MGVAEIAAEVNARLDVVRATLAREVTGKGDVCLTCSFQAEDVLLTKLAIELDPQTFRFFFSIRATTSPRPTPIATALRASGI
jgi:hypothetical protein